MIDLGLDLIFWGTLYVVLLIVIGAMGRQARVDGSLADIFLANRSFGFAVLLFTLFATQYSGNSLSGFPGQTYREGLSYFMSVTFMVAIVTGYLLIAPRLYVLSRERGFLTPTDFLADRFDNRLLNYASATIFTVALLNFLLAQLIALGQAFAGFTQGQIPYWAAVVGGGLVVLAYEVVGGMRAVAWSDALQGVLLLVGLVFVVVFLWLEVGSPVSVVRTIRLLQPEAVANPSLETSFVWLSNFFLLALGAPLYPQAIQRIYAARRLGELRRALIGLAVLPLFAITTVVFIGAVGIVLFPQLNPLEADQVTFRVVSYLVESNALAYYPALLIMMAVVAAIMSTADSCLLSLSSILTKDFVGRARGDGAGSVDLGRWATVFSVAVMSVVILLALRPLLTLWGLLIVKFEILIQLSPAFVLGTLHDRGHPRGFVAGDILPGLASGLAVTLALYLGGWTSVYGLQAGTIGVAVNYGVVYLRRAMRGGAATAA